MASSIHTLIVGAGIAGATLARLQAEAGRSVLVLDRRPQVGGNCYDEQDAAGVLVHRYGPHYFSTNSDRVWNFISRFTAWRKYLYQVKALVDGQLFDFPINLNTINQFYGKQFTSVEAQAFIKTQCPTIPNPTNAEDQVLRQIGRALYDKFFLNYTLKHWGLHPRLLDPEVTARIPLRFDQDQRYSTRRYQAMPKAGYTNLFHHLLDHPKIQVELNCDFLQNRTAFHYHQLIYSGCVDAFFAYRFGPLPYRSVRFAFETLPLPYFQDFPQINYPNDFDYTRCVEIKHATGQSHPVTTLMREYPMAEGEPFYPIPRSDNQAIYLQYQQLATTVPNTFFVGRLATYRYLNMDQVVLASMNLHDRLEANQTVASG